MPESVRHRSMRRGGEHKPAGSARSESIARLDTLFLAMPISWKGTLQQYGGRLHRLHDGKRVVQVYDYVDPNVAMLARMYERRLRGYAAIGYILERSGGDPPAASITAQA